MFFKNSYFHKMSPVYKGKIGPGAGAWPRHITNIHIYFQQRERNPRQPTIGAIAAVSIGDPPGIVVGAVTAKADPDAPPKDEEFVLPPPIIKVYMYIQGDIGSGIAFWSGKERNLEFGEEL